MGEEFTALKKKITLLEIYSINLYLKMDYSICKNFTLYANITCRR